jgi:hypothetical protein
MAKTAKKPDPCLMLAEYKTAVQLGPIEGDQVWGGLVRVFSIVDKISFF